MAKTQLIYKNIRYAFLALMVVIVVFVYIFQIARIPSASMNPTIQPNSLVFVWKLSNTYNRDDIVAFYPDSSNEDRVYMVKRLIGVSGDTLEAKNGILYRNGQIVKPVFEVDYSFSAFVVPKGKIFLLGDNRTNSNDSHVWGVIDEGNLIGKVLYHISL